MYFPERNWVALKEVPIQLICLFQVRSARENILSFNQCARFIGQRCPSSKLCNVHGLMSIAVITSWYANLKPYVPNPMAIVWYATKKNVFFLTHGHFLSHLWQRLRSNVKSPNLSPNLLVMSNRPHSQIDKLQWLLTNQLLASTSKQS